MPQKSLELIAYETERLVNIQIEQFRRLQDKSNTIIGIVSIFIPLFILFIEKGSTFILLISIIPIAFIIIGIILLIKILRSEPMLTGINRNRLEELLNQEDEYILLYKISSNVEGSELNEPLIFKNNRIFNIAINLIVISIILAITILVLNMIF